MKFSITLKVGLLTFLLASIGIFSVAYLSFENSNKTLKKQSIDNMNNDLSREREILSEKLKTMREDALFLGEVPPLSRIIRAGKHRGYDPDENTTAYTWKRQLEEIFKSVLEYREYYKQIRFIGIADKGREIVRVEQVNGTVTAQHSKKLQQKAGRYYVDETLKLDKGEVYFSKIDLNREYGEIAVPHLLTLRVAIPIYDSSSGKPFGLVIINADFSKMVQILEEERESGYYFIANSDGEYLVHPEESKRYQFEFGRSYTIENDFHIKPEEVDSLHQKGEFKFFDISKKRMGVLFQHLHIGGNNKQAYIILGDVADYSTLHASSRNAQKQITVIAIGVALVMTLLVSFGAFLMTHPIGRLKEVVDRIADGEKGVTIPDLGSDEIGSFANSMRAMLAKRDRAKAELRNLAASLELKVDERTKELAESEAEQKAILNSAPDAIIRMNSDGEILSSNPAAIAIFGYTEKELGQMHITAIIPSGLDDFKAEGYAYGLGSWSGEKTVNAIESEAVAKNGTSVPIEYSISEYLAEQSRNYILIIRDITERKLAEDTLAKSEEKYRTLVENADVVAWEYDWGEQRFTYVSDIVFKKFGYTQQEWCGKKIWCDHIYDEDREFALNLCTRASEKGENHDFEYRLLHADGRAIWVRNIISVEMKDGKPSILRGFLLDIDKRKKAEEKSTEAKLAAEEATKLKDKFISLVSHDLRGPLGTMIGFISLVLKDKEEPPSEGAKLILETAVSSGNKMLNMIEELLNISRLKTGKLVPIPKFLDAYFVAQSVITTLENQAEDKGITLVNNIAKNSRIYADNSLLTEVIQNLVSNAIKFCGKGDTIQVFTPSGDKTTIAVEDNGKGISPYNIKKIFSYEEKTSTTGTAGETGTGLGLPLSKDIMEAHGGTLTVVSKPESRITTFYAKLPFVRPLVMIVDDDAEVRTLHRMHLRKLDVEIVEAENGIDALEKLKERIPHLILTNLKMPKMDGLGLLKKIKSDTRFDKTAVIVITSMDDEDTRTNIINLKGDDYIAKPADPNDLIPRIKRFIT